MNPDRQKSLAEIQGSPRYSAWREHLQWELRWIAVEVLVAGVALALVLIPDFRHWGEALFLLFLPLDFFIRYRRFAGRRKDGPVPPPHRKR